jgi:hypothetical protein
MSWPRRVRITFSIPVEFEVSDDFSLSAKEIQEVVDWRVNDYTDGRHPFSTELMHDGATRAADNLYEAIFQSYARRIDAHFKDPAASNKRMTARDALIKRASDKVRPMGIPEHQIQVTAGILPRTVTCPGCGQETIVSKYKECVCGAVLPEV